MNGRDREGRARFFGGSAFKLSAGLAVAEDCPFACALE